MKTKYIFIIAVLMVLSFIVGFIAQMSLSTNTNLDLPIGTVPILKDKYSIETQPVKDSNPDSIILNSTGIVCDIKRCVSVIYSENKKLRMTFIVANKGQDSKTLESLRDEFITNKLNELINERKPTTTEVVSKGTITIQDSDKVGDIGGIGIIK